MSARDCKYCERDDCDTDCSFTDSHFGTTRRSAAEWRAIGAESQHTRIRELEAALGEALDSWVAWMTAEGRGPQPQHDRIATLRRLLEGKT